MTNRSKARHTQTNSTSRGAVNTVSTTRPDKDLAPGDYVVARSVTLRRADNDASLSYTTRSVLFAIVSKMRRNRPSVLVPRAEIATTCGISRRAVNTSINKLTRYGYLTRFGIVPDGGGQPVECFALAMLDPEWDFITRAKAIGAGPGTTESKVAGIMALIERECAR